MVAVAEVQHRHADKYAVGDLFEDDGLIGVGEFGVNFDAPINGTGVHNERTGLEPFSAGFIETEDAGVFADGGEMSGGLALVLDTEEHDGVGVFEGGLEVVADADPHRAEAFGDKGTGTGEGDFGAEFLEADDIGTRDATEEDVAKDGDFFTVERAEFIDEGKGVEECLGGMGMGTIARIDDGDVDDFTQIIGRAGGRVAHNDNICLQRFKVTSGVAEAFALREATGGGRDRDGVSRKVLCGGFKGEPRAGTRLKEEVYYGAAFQVRLFFILFLECFFKGTGS